MENKTKLLYKLNDKHLKSVGNKNINSSIFLILIDIVILLYDNFYDGNKLKFKWWKLTTLKKLFILILKLINNI